MTTMSSAVSSVGAGVSQGRFQHLSPAAHLKDQEKSFEDVRTAALQLLRSALSDAGATGRDLDVLA